MDLPDLNPWDICRKSSARSDDCNSFTFEQATNPFLAIPTAGIPPLPVRGVYAHKSVKDRNQSRPAPYFSVPRDTGSNIFLQISL